MHHGIGETCPTCGCGIGHGHQMGCIGMKGMFMIMPWKIIMHSDELGLGEDQICTLRKRHAEARKQMIQIGSQIKINMIDVQDAVMREEIDMQAAEAKIRKIGKLKGDMFIAMVQAMNDMRQILSPDQRKKVKKMVMSWFKKGGILVWEWKKGMRPNYHKRCFCPVSQYVQDF
ncbi:MAG: Spy/CpxP family protein refolding chaperone [Armatimonadota bacterium]|nr:Spy/CpxP family protein refolding chaperone [bacterium]